MGKKGRRNNRKKAGGNNNHRGQQQEQQTAADVFWSGKLRPPAGYKEPEERPSTSYAFVTDDLVNTILSRGVPNHLDSFDKLKEFLEDSFRGQPPLAEFFMSLAKMLQHGERIINHPILLSRQLLSAPMPLIFWVIQYRFLNYRLGCNLSHSMVDLVVRAGANVNLILPNKTNPLFFAVKYATLETVDFLLATGGNNLLNQRDQFGKTCLSNALEHPDPEIVRRLLEHLPVTEMIDSETEGTGEKLRISLLDFFLDTITSMNPPISYRNLGYPTPNDLRDTLSMLRQAGAKLTGPGSGYSMAVMGYAFKTKEHPQIQNPQLLQDLAKVLVGIDIPEAVRLTMEVPETCSTLEAVSVSTDEDEDTKSEDCPICLSDSKKKVVTLYCGHQFCRSCIIEYVQGGDSVGCPMCRSKLCLDLRVTDPSRSNQHTFSLSHLLGSSASENGGPKFLSEEQVEHEARAQGIYENFLSNSGMRSRLEDQLAEGLELSRTHQPLSMPANESSQGLQGSGPIMVDLASSVSMLQGTPPSKLFISPAHGPISIDVAICGTTLLARISNQSMYTVFSQSAVEQLGLKRIEKLRSKQFVDLNGGKCKNMTFTCLEPVTITIGDGVDITLRNAVEIANSPFDMFGIQLGTDFLLSGTFCAIDVKIGDIDSSYYRVVGEDSWPISKDHSRKESFRYYSHNGKTAELPLIRFNPFGKVSLTISLRENVKLDECSWCCRIFPKGMLTCSACDHAGYDCFYCDKRCQDAAWSIHKKTRSAHQGDTA